MDSTKPFDTNSEEFRHQCEVRYFLKMRRDRGRDAVMREMELIGKRRGEASSKKLLKDAYDQWQRGNRGEHKDWRRE